jgi:hypothetical protein
MRFGSAQSDEAAFYAQHEDEINHIFEYERAIDVLLMCGIRRQKGNRTGT